MVFQLVLHALDPSIKLWSFVGAVCCSKSNVNVLVVHVLVKSKRSYVGKEVEVRGREAVTSQKLGIGDCEMSFHSHIQLHVILSPGLSGFIIDSGAEQFPSVALCLKVSDSVRNPCVCPFTEEALRSVTMLASNCLENRNTLSELLAVFFNPDWKSVARCCGLSCAPVRHLDYFFFELDTSVIKDHTSWLSSTVKREVDKFAHVQCFSKILL